MPKLPFRIVAVLLVPCLAVGPANASALAAPASNISFQSCRSRAADRLAENALNQAGLIPYLHPYVRQRAHVIRPIGDYVHRTVKHHEWGHRIAAFLLHMPIKRILGPLTLSDETHPLEQLRHSTLTEGFSGRFVDRMKLGFYFPRRIIVGASGLAVSVALAAFWAVPEWFFGLLGITADYSHSTAHWKLVREGFTKDLVSENQPSDGLQIRQDWRGFLGLFGGPLTTFGVVSPHYAAAAQKPREFGSWRKEIQEYYTTGHLAMLSIAARDRQDRERAIQAGRALLIILNERREGDQYAYIGKIIQQMIEQNPDIVRDIRLQDALERFLAGESHFRAKGDYDDERVYVNVFQVIAILVATQPRAITRSLTDCIENFLRRDDPAIPSDVYEFAFGAVSAIAKRRIDLIDRNTIDALTDCLVRRNDETRRRLPQYDRGALDALNQIANHEHRYIRDGSFDNTFRQAEALLRQKDYAPPAHSAALRVILTCLRTEPDLADSSLPDALEISEDVVMEDMAWSRKALIDIARIYKLLGERRSDLLARSALLSRERMLRRLQNGDFPWDGFVMRPTEFPDQPSVFEETLSALRSIIARRPDFDEHLTAELLETILKGNGLEKEGYRFMRDEDRSRDGGDFRMNAPDSKASNIPDDTTTLALFKLTDSFGRRGIDVTPSLAEIQKTMRWVARNRPEELRKLYKNLMALLQVSSKRSIDPSPTLKALTDLAREMDDKPWVLNESLVLAELLIRNRINPESTFSYGLRDTIQATGDRESVLREVFLLAQRTAGNGFNPADMLHRHIPGLFDRAKRINAHPWFISRTIQYGIFLAEHQIYPGIAIEYGGPSHLGEMAGTSEERFDHLLASVERAVESFRAKGIDPKSIQEMVESMVAHIAVIAGRKPAEFERLFKKLQALSLALAKKGMNPSKTYSELIEVCDHSDGREWMLDEAIDMANRLVRKGIDPNGTLGLGVRQLRYATDSKKSLHALLPIVQTLIETVAAQKLNSRKMSELMFDGLLHIIGAADKRDWFTTASLKLATALLKQGRSPKAALEAVLTMSRILDGKEWAERESLEFANVLAAKDIDPKNFLERDIETCLQLAASDQAAFARILSRLKQDDRDIVMAKLKTFEKWDIPLTGIKDIDRFLESFEELQKEDIAPTPNLLRQLYRSRNPKSLLTRWHDTLSDIRAGHFDISNQSHVDLSFTLFRQRLLQHPLIARFITPTAYLKLAEDVKQGGDGTEQGDMKPEHLTELLYLAYEAKRFEEYSRQIQTRVESEKRPFVLVLNLSYGAMAASPVEEHLREREQKGLKVIRTKVGSTESHENPLVFNPNLFSDEDLRYIVENRAVLMVVDGSTSVNDPKRTVAHYPDAYQGYLNFMMALHDILDRPTNDLASQFGKSEEILAHLRAEPGYRTLQNKLTQLGFATKTRKTVSCGIAFWTPSEVPLQIRERKQGLGFDKAPKPMAPEDWRGQDLIFVQTAMEQEAIENAVEAGDTAAEFVIAHTPQGYQHQAGYYDDTTHFLRFHLRFGPTGPEPSPIFDAIARQSYQQLAEYTGSVPLPKLLTRFPYRLVLADFDQTLGRTKKPIHAAMAGQIIRLLQDGVEFSVISGQGVGDLQANLFIPLLAFLDFHPEISRDVLTKLHLFTDFGAFGYDVTSQGELVEVYNRVTETLSHKELEDARRIVQEYQAATRGSTSEDHDGVLILYNLRDQAHSQTILQQKLDDANIPLDVIPVGHSSLHMVPKDVSKTTPRDYLLNRYQNIPRWSVLTIGNDHSEGRHSDWWMMVDGGRNVSVAKTRMWRRGLEYVGPGVVATYDLLHALSTSGDPSVTVLARSVRPTRYKEAAASEVARLVLNSLLGVDVNVSDYQLKWAGTWEWLLSIISGIAVYFFTNDPRYLVGVTAGMFLAIHLADVMVNVPFGRVLGNTLAALSVLGISAMPLFRHGLTPDALFQSAVLFLASHYALNWTLYALRLFFQSPSLQKPAILLLGSRFAAFSA